MWPLPLHTHVAPPTAYTCGPSHQGYCAYSLAAYDGLLLQANPSIGVLHYKGRYYGFSNKAAADAFAENPERLGEGVGGGCGGIGGGCGVCGGVGGGMCVDGVGGGVGGGVGEGRGFVSYIRV